MSVEMDEEEVAEMQKKYARRERIGRYFGWHVKRQLSIGSYCSLLFSAKTID